MLAELELCVFLGLIFYMSVNKNNIQDLALNQARKEHVEVTVFLVNGIPLKGRIQSFDNFTMVLADNNKQSLVYKHAVSTVVFPKDFKLNKAENQAAT